MTHLKLPKIGLGTMQSNSDEAKEAIGLARKVKEFILKSLNIKDL